MLTRIKRQFLEARNLMTFTVLTATGQVMPFVVAKFFSPELFGSYSLARMVIFFIAALTISAAQQPFIVCASQEREKTGRITRSFTAQCLFLVISLCLYLAIITAFGKPVASFAGISTSDLVFVSLAFTGFAVKTFVCSLFLALGKRITGALAGLIYEAVAVLFVILFYQFGRIDLRSVFLVYFCSGLLLVIFSVWLLDFGLLLPFDFNAGHFKGMLSFTAWVMLGTTSAYFINWGDNLVLRFFVSMKEIGIYNLSYSIFKGLIFLSSALGHYFLPFISEHIDKKDKLRNYFYVKRPKIMTFGLAGLVFIFFGASYILDFVYQGNYSQAYLTLRILLIGNAVSLYATFFEPLLGALKKYRFLNLLAVMQILVNLILDLLFVPYIGITGAAIATVVAYFCRAVILEIYFRARLRPLFVQEQVF